MTGTLARLRHSWLGHPALRGVRLGVACALLAGLLARAPLARGLEEWLHDGLFAWRGARPSAARVVLVGLDDESLDALGKPAAYLSPELAEVVRHLRAQGAAAVGIDLLVPQSLSTLPEIEREGGLGEAARFGQAAADVRGVVLPRVLTGGPAGLPLPQWRLAELRDALSPDPPAIPLHLGFVDLTEDGDQFVRRQALMAKDGSGAAGPHFALAVYARARGSEVQFDDEPGVLTVGGEPIPLDADQRLRINFAGPPGAFPVLPFREVLAAARSGQALPGLEGAMVFVGVTARSQQDYHATPYANRYALWGPRGTAGLMAGTELHAHVAAALSDRAFLTTPAWLHPWPWLLLTGAALGFAFARLNLERGLLLAVGHHFAWKGIAFAAFALAGWRVEMSGMLLLGALAYGATFGLRWRHMRAALGVVKSEAVARALEADPRRLDPGGEEREVSVLFADVRGFTSFSESHSPREVVALLNAYFTAVVPLVEAAGGTLNQYMGDGVMVIFGAPARQADHALRAARVAVAMARQVRAESATWAKLGYPGMRIGVGVHTGRAVIGCVGSPRRLDYTAIGDTTNTAARIEAENKRLGTEVLLSAATWHALPGPDRGRLGGAAEPVPASVKGKQECLLLYPVLLD